MFFAGDFEVGSTVRIPWNTNAADGSSITRGTDGSIRVYKDSSTTERTSSAGITDSEDFDGVTGTHLVTIDTSNNTDSGFYAIGHDYRVVLVGAVIDGKTVNATLGMFSIENRNKKANLTDVNGNAIPTSGADGYVPAQVIAWGDGSSPSTVLATSLPVATAAGASGGVHILGTNAGTVTYSGTLALTRITLSNGISVSRSTTNGNAIDITGNGTGSGIVITGGATGKGARFVGGSTSGVALELATTSGDAMSVAPTAGHGINIAGQGSAKDGIRVTRSDLDGGKEINAHVMTYNPNHWYVRPTTATYNAGSDSANDGHSEDKPIATFDRLVRGTGGHTDKLQSGQHIHLYQDIEYTEQLYVPGYNDTRSGNGDSSADNLGRDVIGVWVHGNHAQMRGALPTTISSQQLFNASERVIDVRTPAWVFDDIYGIQTGDYNVTYNPSSSSEPQAFSFGASVTVNDCFFISKYPFAFGWEASFKSDGVTAYSFNGPIRFNNTKVVAGRTIIDLGGQTAPLTLSGCDWFTGDKVTSSGLATAVGLSLGHNIVDDSNIVHLGGGGESGAESLVFSAQSGTTTSLNVFNSNVYFRGSAAQTHAALIGFGSRTFTDVRFVNSQVYGPKDIYTGTTVTTFSQAESTFTTISSGAGAAQTWTKKPLKPTVADRDADVSEGGTVGIDIGNIENADAVVNLSGTTIKDATDTSSGIGAAQDAIDELDNAIEATNNNVTAVGNAVTGIPAQIIDGEPIVTNAQGQVEASNGGDVDADAIAEQVASRLEGQSITVSNPVDQDGNAEIWQGDDYLEIDDRGLTWTIENFVGPEPDGAVRLELYHKAGVDRRTTEPTHEFEGEITVSDDTAVFTFELDSQETGDLAARAWYFKITTTQANGHVVTRLAGTFTVR